MTMTVTYSGKEIMEKLNDMHIDVKILNKACRVRDKLIYGSYAFKITVLIILINVN